MPDSQKGKICYFVIIRMVPPSLVLVFWTPELFTPESQAPHLTFSFFGT